MLIDMHTHSYFSPDGTGRPELGIGAAQRAGITVLAVTDHDTIAHIDPCLDAAEREGSVQVIPGFELSCSLRAFDDEEIHVLCYFPNIGERAWRNRALISLLSDIFYIHERWLHLVSQEAALPFHLLRDAQLRLVDAGVIHSSAVPSLRAVKRCAAANDPQLWAAVAAAQNRLRTPSMAKTSPDFPDITEVTPILCALGAVLVLAHPTRFGWTNEGLEARIRYLGLYGVTGLEAGYVPRAADTGPMLHLARHLGISISIGSDIHDLPNQANNLYAEKLRCLIDDCTKLPIAALVSRQ